MTATEPAHHLGGWERWVASHRWAVDALVTVVLAAVLGSLSISGSQGLRWSRAWVLVLVAAFVVLHLSVALRRRWPELAYTLASGSLLLVVLAPDATVSDAVIGGPNRVPAVSAAALCSSRSSASVSPRARSAPHYGSSTRAGGCSPSTPAPGSVCSW